MILALASGLWLLGAVSYTVAVLRNGHDRSLRGLVNVLAWGLTWPLWIVVFLFLMALGF